ncbi:MAG: beta-cystathionase [Pirellulaceae bacterium]|nr:beta-cystathionase [Pirellulaceae bacterium]
MPLSSRIVTAVLAIVIVGGLFYLARSERPVSDELLFGGRSLSEQELDSVEMSFSRAGLNGWKREGRRISIPTQTRSDYLAALQQASSLPVSIRSSVQDAIDKTTIFESSSQRVARVQHAKEQDLGNKLTAFPEIRWASVEYDLGERQGLGRSRQQSASVVVCPEGGDPLSPARIEMIQKFISGSYAGMSRDEVVVIDTHASDAVCQSDDAWDQKRLQEKARIEHQVREILSGYGPIQVAAYVELNSPIVQAASTQHDPTTAPTTATTVSTPDSPSRGEVSSLSSLIGAIASVRSNRATRLQQTAAKIDSGQSRAVTQCTTVPCNTPTLQSVRVSVGLPESYYHQVWKHAYLREHPQSPLGTVPAIDDQQLQRLRDYTKSNILAAVTPALLATATQKDGSSLVEVWDFPDFESAATSRADLPTIVASWMRQNFQPLGLLVMGLIAVWCVWRIARSPQPRTALGQSLASRSSATIPLPNELNNDSDRKNVADNGDNLPVQATNASDNDLLALIESHPDAAVSLIRNWISKAA